MKSVTFARWELDYDPSTTRGLYSKLTSGAPEDCGCPPCRNFAASRKQLYPAQVLDLFDELGIAFDREAEIYHTHRVEPGKHHYGGWFHFVGRIVDGADASRQIASTAWTFDLEKVGESFELGFTHRLGLLPSTFRSLPIVQLEFQATIPWVLSEPEPTR